MGLGGRRLRMTFAAVKFSRRGTFHASGPAPASRRGVPLHLPNSLEASGQSHTFGVAIPRLTASRSPTAVSQRLTEGIASRVSPSTGPRKVLAANIQG